MKRWFVLRNIFTEFLPASLVSIFLCNAFGHALAKSPPNQPPNIVVISADTLRADRLGFYGYEKNTSPNIDTFLEDSVTFSQARTVEPLTAPAFVSMWTGKYPHQHGATRNGIRMFKGLESLPKLLGRHGYISSAFISNWTLKAKLTGLNLHFEEYNEVLHHKRWFGLFFGEATAKDITAHAIDWVQSQDEGPYLLWAHYSEPHAPYIRHREFEQQLGYNAKNLSKSQRYDTEIAFMDTHIGNLLTTLQSIPNTIVIFISDHGENLGEHGYWGHGRHLYEASMRIPMAISWPEKLNPLVIHEPAMIIDIPKTILGLTQQTAYLESDGYDWAPFLLEQDNRLLLKNRIGFFQAHKGALKNKSNMDRGRHKGLLCLGILKDQTMELFYLKGKKHFYYQLTNPAAPLIPGNSDFSPQLIRWANEIQLSERAPQQQLSPGELDQLKSLGYLE